MLPFHLRKGDEDCDGDELVMHGDDDYDINQPQQCECGDFIEIVDSPSPNKLVFWFVGPIAFVNRRLCDSKSSSPTPLSSGNPVYRMTVKRLYCLFYKSALRW